jgi:dTDP-glucose 4,6-dehydratase
VGKVRITMAGLLVTGGAGFIGSNFVHHWLAHHPSERVIVLDALTYSGNLANLEPVRHRPELRFVHGDIRNTTLVEELLRQEPIDTLVHFAAESHVDRSITGPDAFVQANVIGTHSLLQATRRVWLEERHVTRHRFHHISTDEVYGSLGPHAPAFTESTRYAPNSPYSASKAAADHLVRAYHHTYGLNLTTSNCSNNYGRYHFPEKLIPLIIVNILQGKPLPIYGDGLNVRDWLHVSDHCRGIEAILLRGQPGEVYNIGGRCERSNLALVQLLCSIADRQLGERPHLRARFPDSPAAHGKPTAGLITFVKDRPGHDRRYAIDCSKIERELGFSPATPFETGLEDTFNWYVETESWWRDILKGRQRSAPLPASTSVATA